MKEGIEIIYNERIILAEIYSKNGQLGIQFNQDANPQEVNYFLESFVKLEREDYEDYFKKIGEEE